MAVANLSRCPLLADSGSPQSLNRAAAQTRQLQPFAVVWNSSACLSTSARTLRQHAASVHSSFLIVAVKGSWRFHSYEPGRPGIECLPLLEQFSCQDCRIRLEHTRWRSSVKQSDSQTSLTCVLGSRTAIRLPRLARREVRAV